VGGGTDDDALMEGTSNASSNRYGVQCRGCDHYYFDRLIDGVLRLIHPGYRFGDLAPRLPTAQCIASYDYVVFEKCKHCCPESLGICPECRKGEPSEQRCSG
jgi:hypothetical protein